MHERSGIAAVASSGMHVDDAFAQARLLRCGWVGPEPFLLALLAEPSLASEVLAGAGVTSDDVRDHVRSLHEPGADVRAPAMNPAAHQLVGRATGLALASGTASPAPEHWLIALLHAEGGTLPPRLLAGAGTVADALAGRGVPVPAVPPREHRPWRGVRNVFVADGELRPVIDLLLERHPPGGEWRWGCNRVGDPPRGRVTAEEGIPLEAIVRRRGPGNPPPVREGRVGARSDRSRRVTPT